MLLRASLRLGSSFFSLSLLVALLPLHFVPSPAQAQALNPVPAVCQIAFEGILDLYRHDSAAFGKANLEILLNLLRSDLEPLGYQVVPFNESKTKLRVQYELAPEEHRYWLQWVSQQGTVLHSELLAEQSLELALKKNKKLSKRRYQSSLDLLVEIAKDRLFLVVPKLPSCRSLQQKLFQHL